MKNTAFMPKYEYHPIIINGKSFNYKIFLSMDDACKMVKEFIKPSSDSKEIVARFIVNNMENENPSLIDELKEQDDTFFEAILYHILEIDPNLKEEYISYGTNIDACYRFLNAKVSLQRHNHKSQQKTEPTYTKTSLFQEKGGVFFMARFGKGVVLT